MTKRTRKRAYRLSARAESQAETRQRIVDATIELHEKLGPAHTPITAIAERAGVTRLTLYRHFPDEAAIFAACTAHWAALNPFPSATLWDRIKDPTARVAAALAAHYDYFADTGGMWAVVHRDVGLVKPIQAHFAQAEDHLRAVADSLAEAFGRKGAVQRDLRATLRHAITFKTWLSLEDSGLDNDGKVALVLQWLDGVRKSRA